MGLRWTRLPRASAREDAEARELGRAVGWLFRELTQPGQVRVFDATARLRELFAFPAEDVRQQRLGFLLGADPVALAPELPRRFRLAEQALLAL